MKSESRKSLDAISEKSILLGYQQGVMECMDVLRESRNCFENQDGIDKILEFLDHKFNKKEVTV